MLWFGGEALCFVTTIRVLLKVLGKTIVMVLLCHSNDCGYFSVLSLLSFQGVFSPVSLSVVRDASRPLVDCSFGGFAPFAECLTPEKATTEQELKGNNSH